MLFLPTAAIVSCLLVIPSALCTMTAIQVVDSMQNAIAICKNTNVALQSLSTSDTVVKVGAVGGGLVASINATAVILTNVTVELYNTPPFDSEDSVAIANTLVALTNAIGVLLSTLTSKHFILAQFSYNIVVSIALGTFRSTVGVNIFNLKPLIPSQVPLVTTAEIDVDRSLNNCKMVYDQLCIPAPLYPVVMPSCTCSSS